MAGSLDGKVVIITGGARGIGRAYAHGVAKEGGRVVIADLLDGEPVVAEVAAAGREATAVTTDVSDEASNEAMAAAAIEQFGRIDILINNAAMFSETTRGPFHELTIAEWRSELRSQRPWCMARLQGRIPANEEARFREEHQCRVNHGIQRYRRVPPLCRQQVGPAWLVAKSGDRIRP